MENNLPVHVAIIMDGNRRWAKGRKLLPNVGHEAGVDALEVAIRSAVKFGVKYLTVYALSTENLKGRSRLEISFLFSLIKKGLKEKLPAMDENGVHIKFIGDVSSLPSDVQKTLEQAELELSKNKRLFLNVAVNYSGRDEIAHAVRNANKPLGEIKVADIEKNLYTSGIPDPDLIIRTGGRKRLSNFLLWQSSYAELLFPETLWPDFGERDLKKALREYDNRVRNFGR
jgi:undecaprenyl diphosphate synthase